MTGRQRGHRPFTGGNVAMMLLAGAAACLAVTVAAAPANAGTAPTRHHAHAHSPGHAAARALVRSANRAHVRTAGRAQTRRYRWVRDHVRVSPRLRWRGGYAGHGDDDGPGGTQIIRSGNGKRNNTINEIASPTSNRGFQHTSTDTMGGATGIQNALCKNTKVCTIHLQVTIINSGGAQQKKEKSATNRSGGTTSAHQTWSTPKKDDSGETGDASDDCCCD
ncbi:hypothetical protein Sme01_50860 [Sphaerisporangium melleum]|uniref:Uncharacterized protein n=1 Tax=Sphaerisporangium melleum TaxID=321316 RepID=A0A917QYC0_9ACTN|nr:hypothetical protein [Sphaerisporangium melleum]GGK75249.1 hypothetical protein GCM10007964_17610 [Sphaerisporangium melleum]GII72610.1 hypothetical protein Sme01_50860 [Sphaerisporangium melleum]